MFKQLFKHNLNIILKSTQIRVISNTSDKTGTKLCIFSAIQPTGALHLGNYLGAVRKWVDLQSQMGATGGVDRCMYSVVDMHSMTTIKDRQQMSANVKLMVASLIGCGVDPDVSVLFRQSDVPEHGQLAWILATLVNMGALKRFPQFKEKTEGMKDIPLGLFLYPVLQVADILLYKSNAVPVGDDQIPHIHFAKDLAIRFNTTFEKTFPVPNILAMESLGRIKSLRRVDKKMSKSEPNMKSRIEMTDSDDEIQKKIMRAVTDMRSEVTYNPIERPGVSNLVLIYASVSGLTVERVCDEMRGRNTCEFKQLLAQLLVEHLRPIRDRVLRILADESYVERVLNDGRIRAATIAERTMTEVYDRIGSKLIVNNNEMKINFQSIV